ncbi:MAG: HAMP domain-containing histidine kinase [Planctomycetes bacterium]|nr:HAMP domain-containing histidine kinase [Planctomycetota bacterium]
MKDKINTTTKLHLLEKSEWSLWILALVIIIIYTVCIMVVAQPDIWNDVISGAAQSTFIILVSSLFILTVLLCFYIIYRERVIKKLRKGLFADERMSAMAHLAARITHDLNNKMTIATGLVELVLKSDLPREVKSDLENINAQHKEINRLLENLLVAGRQKNSLSQLKQADKHEAVDLAGLVKSVLDSMQAKMTAHHIVLNHAIPEWATPGESIRVNGDRHQLFEGFLNLVKNAVEAMEKSERKELIVRYERSADNKVLVRISDTGPGIKPEVMRNIFEPFVTTKQPGKGTGLGLNITKSIISQHGGKISAKNNTDRGAAFIVELSTVHAGDAPTPPSGDARPLRASGETQPNRA